MGKERKSRAFNASYESPRQQALAGFETPFERHLRVDNRWVVLAGVIPWDEIDSIYRRVAPQAKTGRKPLNSRIVVGSLIIKHIMNLDDREVVQQIAENLYLQYFLGYSGFIAEPPFDASLFVDFRHTLGDDVICAINEKVVQLRCRVENPPRQVAGNKKGKNQGGTEAKPDTMPGQPEQEHSAETTENKPDNSVVENRGTVIMDATCCPQDIAFPTDLTLLSDAREKAEELIDFLYDKTKHGETKPRTYRKEARKAYLQTAQKKNKGKKEIRKAVGKQLRYLRRDIKAIHHLLDAYSDKLPFDKHQLKYFYVIQTLYNQQNAMHVNHTHTIEDRIVSIHQPHVRPIVRGKAQAKVEFGAKIHASVVGGIMFLDEINWDAFNEGSHMGEYIEQYRSRFGFYPRNLLADKIYCTRANRTMLKEKGIVLKAKPLGRPSLVAALSNHVSPGERNPVEGKFGQAKTAYGMNRIKARLRDTSQSWIACIVMVLNLVKLAGIVPLCLIVMVIKGLTAIFIGCNYNRTDYFETVQVTVINRVENMNWRGTV